MNKQVTEDGFGDCCDDCSGCERLSDAEYEFADKEFWKDHGYDRPLLMPIVVASGLVVLMLLFWAFISFLVR